MADYGTKISSPGVSVLTAADSQLRLTSKRKCLKVAAPQQTDITTVFGGLFATGSGSLGFSLAFIPVVIPFINYAGAIYIMPFVNLDLSFTQAYHFVDSNSVNFDVTTDAAATVNIYTYLSETERVI